MQIYSFFQGIKNLFSRLVFFIFSFKRYLPLNLTCLIILIDLSKDILNSWGDWTGILSIIALRVTAIDYRVYQLVSVYTSSPESFGWFDFFSLLSYVYMIYFIIKLLTRVFSFLGGTTVSPVFYWSIAILLLGILEYSSVKVIYGNVIFPFKGVWLFVTHLIPILNYLWQTHNINHIWERIVNQTVAPELRTTLS